MPDNRINVFVSSTSYDLPEFRKAVLKLLKTLKLQPRGAEYWTVKDPVALCKQDIAESDLFIGIYGNHPGWQPPDHGGQFDKQQCSRVESGHGADDSQFRRQPLRPGI